MTHVFTLKATGKDGIVGECPRTVESTNCFATRELAERRIENFRTALLDHSMMVEPITIEVIPHEVVYQ